MCIRYQLMMEYPDTLADARQPWSWAARGKRNSVRACQGQSKLNGVVADTPRNAEEGVHGLVTMHLVP